MGGGRASPDCPASPATRPLTVCGAQLPHTAEENWTPLYDVRTAGTPNLLTQLLKKAAAQLAVDVLTKVTASAHLVLLSTMVSRWVQPPGEAGKGPTISMWT